MKRYVIVLAVIALAALFMTALPQRAKEAETLFHRGVHFEEVRGELKEALAVYEKIIKEFPDVRTIVAKAILRTGICYEKMGQEEAQKSYRRVIDEYADQGETVAEAKTRLERLGGTAPAAIKGSAPLIRRIWEGTGFGVVGAASPDGRYICVQDQLSGNLLLRDLTTGDERFLTKNSGDWWEYALYSEFSSDGKQIAYSWFNKDGSFEIRTIGLDGMGIRTVVGNLNVIDVGPAGWSPDGRSLLAFISRVGGIHEIVQIIVQDGATRVLKTIEGVVPSKVSLSPDGRYLAYDRLPAKTSQNLDIYLMAIADGQEVPLVEHEAGDGVIGWAPDGKGVLFLSNRTGSFDLWLVPVADGRPQGKPELVKKDVGEVKSLGITRRGALFYGAQAQVSDVYTAAVDVEAGKVLSSPVPVSNRGVGTNDSPAWSPDGKWLAYVLRQKGLLCLHSTDSGEERDFALGMYFRWPLWSPDGKRILVWGRKEPSDYGFYFVDPQTGAVTPFVLSKDGRGVQQAAWSPDGKAVYFRRFTDDFQDGWFIRCQVDTGEETELLHNYPINDSAVSPDSQRIVFRSYDKPDYTLKTMLSSGGDIREIVRIKPPEYIPGYSGLAWTPDGRFILYFTAREGAGGAEKAELWKTELWRVDVRSGERKSFGLTMDRMRNIALHPDGKRVAFDSGNPKVEIWVMENFLTQED